jgi:hypothetical protein
MQVLNVFCAVFYWYQCLLLLYAASTVNFNAISTNEIPKVIRINPETSGKILYADIVTNQEVFTAEMTVFPSKISRS